MKKIFLIVILLNGALNLKAQKIDTVWYNKQNIEVKNIDERDHYKTTKYNTDTQSFEVIGYRSDGKVAMMGYFLSLNPPIKDGTFTSYDKNGIIVNKTSYSRDVITEFYDYKDGKQIDHIINKDNPPINSSNDKSAKYISIGAPIEINESPVEYSEGEAALKSFIKAHLNYPKEALLKKIQGIVFIEIKIDEKGNAYDINVLRPADPLLNNEAIRIVKLIPNTWITAKNAHKQPVKSSMTIPIKFSL